MRIENQLEQTDHRHLGQLISYAAGLKAVTTVWIAARFIDEHRAAIDWLNEISNDEFRFFALEIELWRIGESFAAPRLNIVSEPNKWSKTVSATRHMKNGALSDTEEMQLILWEELYSELSSHPTLLPRNPGVSRIRYS